VRRLKKYLAVTFGAAMLFVASTGTAAADNGNNLPLCSNFEICFWFNSSNILEKQFHNNSNHGGYNFWQVVNGNYVTHSEVVKDNAREITNKDSQCDVFVGSFSEGRWTWEAFPNNHGRFHLGTVNNRNDYHQRCGV
jgi:hypothetical protein